MTRIDRREFLKTGALLGAAAVAGETLLPDRLAARPSPAGNPVVITSANGAAAAAKAMAISTSCSTAAEIPVRIAATSPDHEPPDFQNGRRSARKPASARNDRSPAAQRPHVSATPAAS